MGKDDRHRRFYIELTRSMAKSGRAMFYFLRSGDRDIAGSLLLMSGSTVYERHIALDPEYSPLSPGIFLRTEILKDLFGTSWTKLDLMGLRRSVGRQRHKADWATEHWESISQHCYRKYGRATALVIARVVRDWLRNLRNRRDTIGAQSDSQEAA